MASLTNVTYKLKINGSLGEEIIPKGGIRQGDPLSPYLFIIVAEALSNMLTNSLDWNKISGISLSKHGPKFNHLFFADDSMLFTNASCKEAYELINVLNCYTMASGQRINLHKSGIIFSKNCPNQIKQEIIRILGMEEWANPGKYLGLTADWRRSKQNILKEICEKIISKTKGWREKFLSQAGKGNSN